MRYRIWLRGRTLRVRGMWSKTTAQADHTLIIMGLSLGVGRAWSERKAGFVEAMRTVRLFLSSSGVCISSLAVLLAV